MEEQPIKLKVCGMRERDNIRVVSQLQPQFMGFIFYPSSPRWVGDDFVMPEDLSASTKRVGVFVNDTTDSILEKVRQFKLDFVQLHGEETIDQCRQLKQHGVGVIKVFSVDDDMDFQVTKAYEDVADYFLFDTKGIYYGGNARTFNWEVLTRYNGKKGFFLSGGITPDHIEGIKKLSNANLVAVDVNSGVEIRPALKDVDKVKAIKTKLTTK
jgi:phosphoribosylanthranilate isomerase